MTFSWNSKDRKKLTWRAYDFSIDYLIDRKSQRESPKEAKTTLEEAVRLAQDFRNDFPYDERSYGSLAKAYEAAGDSTKSEMVLEEAFKKSIEDGLPIAQCCVDYIDLLVRRGDYKKVQKVAAIGLASTAKGNRQHE